MRQSWRLRQKKVKGQRPRAKQGFFTSMAKEQQQLRRHGARLILGILGRDKKHNGENKMGARSKDSKTRKGRAQFQRQLETDNRIQPISVVEPL